MTCAYFPICKTDFSIVSPWLEINKNEISNTKLFHEFKHLIRRASKNQAQGLDRVYSDALVLFKRVKGMRVKVIFVNQRIGRYSPFLHRLP